MSLSELWYRFKFIYKAFIIPNYHYHAKIHYFIEKKDKKDKKHKKLKHKDKKSKKDKKNKKYKEARDKKKSLFEKSLQKPSSSGVEEIKGNLTHFMLYKLYWYW